VNIMAVVFEISGRMAMFRKPYTTTSSMSFAFPPPTAVAGLICAIVGIRHGSEGVACSASFWAELKGTRIALALRKPISWLRQTVNFTNIKEPQKNPHIQVKHQFIANPCYCIFVSGGLEGRLRSFLEQGHFTYTPCLGVAYALADIRYRGSYQELAVKDDPITIDTVVPWDESIELDVLGSGGAFKELVPFRMDENRQLLKSSSVLYATSPENKIKLKKRGSVDVSQCGDDVVAWFPAW